MTSEARNCQNCKQGFTIEPEDFEFYAKIKVPAPTFCPECRFQRRLTWRNERTLYRRACDLCTKQMFSRFAADVPFPVYCAPCWYSDNWDPLSYGQDYDFSKSFFQQFYALSLRVPKPALYAINAVNSDYANHLLDVKNVYLSVSIVKSEDIYYSYRIDKSRDVFDVAFGRQIERCFESIDITNATNLFYAQRAKGSLDSYFLYDVHNAEHCLGCVNQRNIKYKVFNEQYSPEEYAEKLKGYDLGSYRRLTEFQQKFETFRLAHPHKFAHLEKCVGVTGDSVSNAKNCKQFFDGYDAENCNFMYVGIDGVKDSYDLSYAAEGAELSYDGSSILGYSNKFSVLAYGREMEYCDSSPSRTAKGLFGCISIKGKNDFCILNRQYTETEYKNMREKIIAQMNADPYRDALGRIYRYGEHFPVALSPFAYNETQAQELFSLTKEEALRHGYRWRDEEAKTYQISMAAKDLPDHIRDVDTSILQATIGCEHEGKCIEHCSTGFRILYEELDFLKRVELPLPRLCPNCRHAARIQKRTPPRLWERACQCAGPKSENRLYINTVEHFHKSKPCPNPFQTSYAPDRPEIVYCESCYNAEVV